MYLWQISAGSPQFLPDIRPVSYTHLDVYKRQGEYMAALKYSRQRECIREFVLNCQEHPTADTVYAEIKKEFPNISLGTVYRNLSLLVELGEIAKLSLIHI